MDIRADARPNKDEFDEYFETLVDVNAKHVLSEFTRDLYLEYKKKNESKEL